MSSPPYESSWRQPGIGMPSSTQQTDVRAAPTSTTHADGTPAPKHAHAASSCAITALKPNESKRIESSSCPSRRSNWSGSTTTAHASRVAAAERPSCLSASAHTSSIAVRSIPGELQPPSPPTGRSAVAPR